MPSLFFSRPSPIDLSSLVISDINGAFEKAFSHVAKLNEKAGPFSMLLAVGNFFGAADAAGPEFQAYARGEKIVPIPTYFIVPPAEESKLASEILIDGGVLAQSALFCIQSTKIVIFILIFLPKLPLDLIYLGRVGCKDINGFQLAYISTLTAKEDATKPGMVTSTSESAAIEAELSRVFKSPNFPGVDILLSNQWPRSILAELGDNPPPVGVSLMEYDTFGSELVRKAAAALAPRYHFSASPSHIHYERPPFVCDLKSKNIVHVSRFIALADAFNDKKAKVRAFVDDPGLWESYICFSISLSMQ